MYSIEIEIDKPEGGWLNTAIVVREYHSVLSENSVSYWCYLSQYEIEVRIGKEGKAGQQITRQRKQGVSVHQMEMTVLSATLPCITPAQFCNLIANTRKQGIKDGRNSIRLELNDLLEEEL